MKEHSDKIRALLEQLPDADQPGRASKLAGPPADVAGRVAKGILDGGRESVVELAAMISDAYRPRYALRLLTLYASEPGREKIEGEYRAALASIASSAEISERSPFARRAAIEELELIGDRTVVDALGEALADDDLRDVATRALVAIGSESAAVLRQALKNASGDRRAAVVQALGTLRDEASLESLTKLVALDGKDESATTLAAVVALAQIGSEKSISTVLDFADRATAWDRIQATKACFVLAERLAESKQTKAARKIYSHLRETRKDPKEAHVRESARRALAAM